MAPTEQEVHEAIAEMLLSVDQSLEAVWAVHQILVRDEALYLAVWWQLGAPFRRSWTGALEDYRANQHRAGGECLTLPSADGR